MFIYMNVETSFILFTNTEGFGLILGLWQVNELSDI